MAVVIEFVGGPRDGTQLSTASTDPKVVREADGIYNLSQQGTVGRKHRTFSEAAEQILQTQGVSALINSGMEMDQVYRVISKAEKDGDITVRIEYVGQE
jgi:hypothetical protein